ncbi:MAG TPA: LamG-like jellyroll fold domain-containing protein [Polyangiaceae bacterium]
MKQLLSRRARVAVAVALGSLAVAASACTGILGSLAPGESADASAGDGSGDGTMSDTGPGADSEPEAAAEAGADVRSEASQQDTGTVDTGSGETGPGDASDGSTCTPGGSCMPTAACHNGVIACSGGQPTCMPSTTVNNGTMCDAGAVCDNGTCIACSAGTDCSEAGSCEAFSIVCSSGTPTCTDMGPATNGKSCGANLYCDNGVCAPCTNGASCVPTGAPCDVGSVACTGGTATCNDTGTHAQDGTGCGTNMVCSGGSCVPCTAGLSCTPANPCDKGTTSCSTGTSTCTDTGTPLMNGSSCGSNMVCLNGACNPCTQGASCTPTNVCDTGSTDCTSGSPVCTDQGANSGANGTTCATGKQCFNGACDTPATLAVAPTYYNFGSVTPGQTVTKAFVVSNGGMTPSGSVTANISGNTPAQFTVGGGCGPLAGGGTCTIQVSFNPQLAGPYSAVLTLAANPGGSIAVPLAGTAGAPCGNFLSDGNTVALWHFDEGTGLTTADASGNGHTGTLGNSTTANAQDPTWGTGRFSNALFYAEANSQYVQATGTNAWPGNQATLEFWEKGVAPFGSATPGYSQPFTAGFICFAVNISTQYLQFGVGDGNNWSYQVQNTTVPTDGNWHYIAFVFTGPAQEFYVDGNMIGAVSTNPTVTLQPPGGYGYQIGGRPANTFFNGTIDEMRLSNIAKTQGQIANYYASASTCP